nr:hypothetical protein CFP56_13119 [Quercus suber]
MELTATENMAQAHHRYDSSDSFRPAQGQNREVVPMQSCPADLCKIYAHKRTSTSTQGMRNCFFSSTPRNHSNTLPPADSETYSPPPIRLLIPSIAALANDPPVPLMADTARLAVSIIASVIVAFPLTNEDSVSDALSVLGCHRGSNQSALKSKRAKTKRSEVEPSFVSRTCLTLWTSNSVEPNSDVFGSSYVIIDVQETRCLGLPVPDEDIGGRVPGSILGDPYIHTSAASSHVTSDAWLVPRLKDFVIMIPRSQALFVSPEPDNAQEPSMSTRKKLVSTQGKGGFTYQNNTSMLTNRGGGEDVDMDENNEHNDNTDDDDDDDDDDPDTDSEHERRFQQNRNHDPSQERLPLHPAFDQAVPGIKSRLISSVEQVLSTLELYSPDNRDLRAMLEWAKENVQEVEVPKKRFGFVGDTGMGKSATINSITGIAGLAKADASGQSCTHVVTLYKHRLDFQDPETTPFAAEVRYLDIDKCKVFLSEQLDNYNRFTFEREIDWDAEEFQEYELLRDQALAMFQSLFFNREEFESPRASTEFLQASYKDPHKPVLGSFVAWCEQHFEELDTIDKAPVRQFSAGTLTELNNFLEPNVYQKADVAEPVLCSLIEHVSYVLGTTSIRGLR